LGAALLICNRFGSSQESALMQTPLRLIRPTCVVLAIVLSKHPSPRLTTSQIDVKMKF
jgi:hypothetical protein